MIDHSLYETPFSSRYASNEMSYLFSPHFKYTTWRKLWVALAKAQKELGIPITDKQIKELEGQVENVDFHLAAEYEKKFRHDVMAHLYAYGEQCPEAKPFIHLGATSCYVTDNGDLIQMREGLKILRAKLIQIIRQLADFASKYSSLATLSFTHFQPAQPTTVGKRACLWIQDCLMDLKDLEIRLDNIHFLGVKGATGTQASFVSLFDHDHGKVKQLEILVAKEMGFQNLFKISGQTYTRKQDMRIFSVLNGIAATAHKFGSDLRLLAHLKELEEPFEEKQIGSSAMPYKRNPVRAERICGLSRFLISLNENPSYTAANQWLERSLDDSSNRRLALSEGFLCADSILNLLCDITSGIVVNPKIISRHLDEEIPFLATENILMHAVKTGKDRQEIHEKLRKHSLEAAKKIKEEGQPGDLLRRISEDPSLGLSAADLADIIKLEYFTGMSAEQTHDFLNQEVNPILTQYKDIKPYIPSISV